MIATNVRRDLAAVSPLYNNGYLYVTTGYTKEGMPNRGTMFELFADATSFTKKWTERTLDCYHGGLIFLDGFLHGSSSAIYPPQSKEIPKGTWYCLDLATDRMKYEGKLVGKGSVIYADGVLYCLCETGTLGLVKLTDNGYEMVSSFRVTDEETEQCWAHPAISDDRLYIRYRGDLMAYDIKAK